MTQTPPAADHAASGVPPFAAEPPGLGADALGAPPQSRPGFAVFVPGECLKLDAQGWSLAQRDHGVWVKGVYLTASEEEEAISDAHREGRLGAVISYQIRKSLFAVADSIQGEDGMIGPGAWRRLTVFTQRPCWDELGPKGRVIFTQAYQLAHTPSQAAREVAQRSFRLVG